MVEFFAEHLLEIFFGLLSAGALALCKHFHSQTKAYKKMQDEKKDDLIAELIEEKTLPIIEELQKLRDKVMAMDREEHDHIGLIIDSWKYRLIQLCRAYLTQGYMTQSQYDQLAEMYRLYSELGGNGQAHEYYEKTCKLQIRPNENVVK